MDNIYQNYTYSTHSTPFTEEFEDTIDLTVKAKVHYTPGSPGFINGLPEQCSAPEPPDVDVTDLKISIYGRQYSFDKDGQEILEALEKLATETILAGFEDKPNLTFE